jgi:parallel beta-helix repeat protein
MRRMICSGKGIATLAASLALVLVAGGSALAATTIPATGPFPYVISAPGDYVLGGDVSTNKTAIQIKSSNVRLNLNGKTITGPRWRDYCFWKYGVEVAPGVKNIGITNGTIQKFEHGIKIWRNVTQVHISRVNLTLNCENGIDADSSGLEYHTYAYVRAWKNDKDGICSKGKYHQFCYNCVHENGRNGIDADVDYSEFACNTAAENEDDGLDVKGYKNIFWANTACFNKGHGIKLYGDGNGLAKNRTSGNYGDGIRLVRGSRDNILKWNVAYENQEHDLHDGNLDRSPPACVNTWTQNYFTTDNEGDGPGAGCIR